MENKRLKRYLQSVGMMCFIEYYEDFKNEGLSNQYIADKIFKDKNYTYKACNSRTGHARMIIREGGAKTALEKIANSKRVDTVISQKAQKILNTDF